MRITTLTLGALGLSLAAPAAAQQDRGRFELLDGDEDGVITRAELTSSVGVVVDAWDIDRDGRINDREMTRAMFRSWDADGDRAISTAEFTRRGRGWFARSSAISFERLDRDGDETLSLFEVYRGLRVAEFFQVFDPDHDGWITAPELADGLIATLDRDDDGALTQREWPLAAGGAA